jgi:glutamate dehydrogenase/leucine dehydrogenase
MVDEYSKLTGDTTKGSFTGKSLGNGGSKGREAATGRGGVIALRELLKHEALEGKEVTIAVQGFGNVGMFFSTVGIADHPNWKIVAASDSGATVAAAEGLDIIDLELFKQKRGRFSDYKAAGTKVLPSEDVLVQEVDVLVLAALGDAITADNMKHIKAKYIIELANGPVNTAAYDYLTEHGSTILPDIIANAGGVIVSYLEWFQNMNGEDWTEEKVNAELERYMTEATRDLYKTAKEHDTSLKEAAFINAIHRLK